MITEAPQSASYGAWRRAQENLAAAILKDPDVVSLSSFVGVDGTNITLNSRPDAGEPEAARRTRLTAARIISRLQTEWRASPESRPTCSRSRT